MKLSEKIKDGIWFATTTKNELIKAIEALEKQVGKTECNCSAEETTGWTTFRLCNICGKIQKR